MRVELFEKLISLSVILAVLFVGATVVLLSIFPPRSGIPAVAEASDDSTWNWLEAQRAKKHGLAVPGKQDIIYEDRQAAPATLPKGNNPQAVQPKAAKAPDDYFVSDPTRAQPGEVIEGFPWLKKVPGVQYHRPKRMSRLLYRKYQSFEDSWNLAQQGGGEFVTTRSGDTAYKVNWVDQSSLLAQRIGLKPGDKVISVNGNPIGNSVSAGKALYEQLKGETRFAVLVERQGQQQVLSYYVN